MRHRHLWHSYRRVEIVVQGQQRSQEGIEKRCDCGATAWCQADRWRVRRPRRKKVEAPRPPPETSGNRVTIVIPGPGHLAIPR